MDRPKLIELTDAYKEQIYTKLLELLPQRLAQLTDETFKDKSNNEVLALIYVQGAAEALDGFDMDELLQAIAREHDALEGLEA